jgi:hypothetical protein
MNGKYRLTGGRERRTLWIRDVARCFSLRVNEHLSDPNVDERKRMSSTIQVEAARVPDRDRLLRELREHEIDAQAVDELGIVVRCADGDDAACAEVFSYVESAIMSIGAPFVPTKHQDVIYIRPPVG